MTPTILFADDEREAAQLTISLLRPHLPPEVTVLLAETHQEAISLLGEFNPLVVISDLALDPATGSESGFALIREIHRHSPRPEVLVLTSHHDALSGIEALKHGAAAFLAKPPHPEHLATLILNAINNALLRDQYQTLQAAKDAEELAEFQGNSSHAARIREQIRFAATSKLPLLITGESGTGKGLVAHAVHRRSRLSGKFVRYQANFVSGDLFASELFGHTKGAFTGAITARRGLLLDAHNGSFFLDEIDELPLSAQVTLLGTLQEKLFRQLGANNELSSQFRLISATNFPIPEALERGKLRRDFFHRISAITIHIPPLRERADDIASLARASLERAQLDDDLPAVSISEPVLAALHAYSWPGNVRELIQEIHQAAHRALFRGDNQIMVEDLSGVVRGGAEMRELERAREISDFNSKVKAYKRALVKEALEKTGNNQVHAARLLGIDRGSLRRVLEGD
jgi:DNA-binding NtrC family response regulator